MVTVVTGTGVKTGVVSRAGQASVMVRVTSERGMTLIVVPTVTIASVELAKGIVGSTLAAEDDVMGEADEVDGVVGITATLEVEVDDEKAGEYEAGETGDGEDDARTA